MKLDKLLSLTMVAVILATGFFLFGAYSARKQTLPFRMANEARDTVVTAFRDVFNLAKKTGNPAAELIQPSRGYGQGVTVNEATDQDALILLSGFIDGGNEIRLINRGGDTVARWPLSYTKLFPTVDFVPRPATDDLAADTHGALINSDGSIVFNFDYGGSAKVNRCGVVDWTLQHPTHHSVEISETGGYWIPGRTYYDAIDQEKFPPFTKYYAAKKEYAEDLILKVSESGEILLSKSVPEIFYENNLLGPLTAIGDDFDSFPSHDYELLHLNKIGELSAAIADDFPQFPAGSLVLSLREHNLITVVDPTDWRILWYQVGPWIRQHDPEFNPGGTLTIFNNNAYRYGLGSFGWHNIDGPKVSNVISIDPVTRETSVLFGAPAQGEMLTHIRGKHELTPSGGYIMTEFEGGRAIEIDADGNTVWEYVNGFDDTHVGELTEVRVYPADYFNVENWNCP